MLMLLKNLLLKRTRSRLQSDFLMRCDNYSAIRKGDKMVRPTRWNSKIAICLLSVHSEFQQC